MPRSEKHFCLALRQAQSTNGGALSAYGVEVRQEKNLPSKLNFVRQIASYNHCADIQLDVLDVHTIRIKPDMDTHVTKPKLPKTFNLKPL